MKQCDHYWVPQTKADGSEDFRKMGAVDVVNAKCDLCNARTFFTRDQWRSIPAVEAP